MGEKGRKEAREAAAGGAGCGDVVRGVRDAGVGRRGRASGAAGLRMEGRNFDEQEQSGEGCETDAVYSGSRQRGGALLLEDEGWLRLWGHAVNRDGRNNRLTTPNMLSHVKVAARVVAKGASVGGARDSDVVGRPPIEVQTLGAGKEEAGKGCASVAGDWGQPRWTLGA